LPSGGSIVGKYMINGETSFTTFMTSDTDNDVSHEALNIESSGNELPIFKELKLRFELTGAAEITGILIKYEEIVSTL